MSPDDPTRFAAIVVAGGRAARLDGVDKALVEVDGRTLLARTLEALVDADEVVVVGTEVPTDRAVTFVLEDPRHGGPVAGLLTGLEALSPAAAALATVVVLPVDMPDLDAHTVRRLRVARDVDADTDGAVLVDATGRRQLALALDRRRLEQVAPDREQRHGCSVRDLLAPLDLVDVAATGHEADDVDTWADLRAAQERHGRS